MDGSYRVELCNLSVCLSFLLKADQIALWVWVWFGFNCVANSHLYAFSLALLYQFVSCSKFLVLGKESYLLMAFREAWF